jgi:hypothetical protein
VEKEKEKWKKHQVDYEKKGGGRKRKEKEIYIDHQVSSCRKNKWKCIN